MQRRRIVLACETILSGNTRTVDIGVCNGKPMLLLAGIGFEAEVINSADREAKNWLGILAYIVAGLGELGNLKQFDTRIETEDKIITVSAAALTVANAAPPTSILAQGAANIIFNDGLLDLTIVATQTQASTRRLK